MLMYIWKGVVDPSGDLRQNASFVEAEGRRRAARVGQHRQATPARAELVVDSGDICRVKQQPGASTCGVAVWCRMCSQLAVVFKTGIQDSGTGRRRKIEDGVEQLLLPLHCRG